jgi:hypothetical protein
MAISSTRFAFLSEELLPTRRASFLPLAPAAIEYHQVDRKTGGTGLDAMLTPNGLWSCMVGACGWKSSVGQGSTFIVSCL